MPLIVHELITAELWREKIFKQLFKVDFKPNNTFVIYLIVRLLRIISLIEMLTKSIQFQLNSFIMKLLS